MRKLAGILCLAIACSQSGGSGGGGGGFTGFSSFSSVGSSGAAAATAGPLLLPTQPIQSGRSFCLARLGIRANSTGTVKSITGRVISDNNSHLDFQCLVLFDGKQAFSAVIKKEKKTNFKINGVIPYGTVGLVTVLVTPLGNLALGDKLEFILDEVEMNNKIYNSPVKFPEILCNIQGNLNSPPVQVTNMPVPSVQKGDRVLMHREVFHNQKGFGQDLYDILVKFQACLLYTSDAADE